MNLPPPRAELIRIVCPFIYEQIYTPASQYMHGDISHNAFRDEVVAAMDNHLERLAGQMPVDSTVEEQLWHLEIVRSLWWEELENVDSMAPKRLRLDLKIAKGWVRELEDRVRQFEDVVSGDSGRSNGETFDRLEIADEAGIEAGPVRGTGDDVSDSYNDLRSRPSIRQYVRMIAEETW